MSRIYPIASPARRRGVLLLLVLGALILLGLACLIPWRYPSSSLLYQFGLDRTLMLAGKSMGVAAGFLLVVQLLLVLRWPWLERLAAQNQLVTIHRWLGGTLIALAILHPLLVFVPDDLRSIPVSMEYWPEMIGAGLLLALAALAILSTGRDYLGMPHLLWKLGHRFTAPVLMTALMVHVLYVNDGYASGVPRYAVAGAAVGFGLLWLWIVVRPLRRSRPHEVNAVSPAARNTMTVTMRPLKKALVHAPGQFVYLRFRSRHISAEEHPFTIASAPGDARGLSVTVRCIGDWTSLIGRVQPGERVHVQGPYGLFSPDAYPGWKHLVFIAGGVGITPMLSVLRAMAAGEPDRRRVTLIWSNQTPDDIAHAEEMAAIERKLPNFRVTHVLDRGAMDDGAHNVIQGPIDQDILKQHVGSYTKGNLVFLCGPSGFMKVVRSMLRKSGYPGSAIKTEKFRL